MTDTKEVVEEAELVEPLEPIEDTVEPLEPEEDPVEETSTELVVVDTPSPLARPAQSFTELEYAAKLIAWSPMVPQAYQGKPGAIVAAGLMGAELGWPLMASLRFIYVVDGAPSLMAEGLGARIREAGHHMTIVEMTNKRCVLSGKRIDNGDEATVEFTIEDAETAGLLGKTNWKKYPKAMLFARALTLLHRVLFQDISLGASYTPDEMGDDGWIPVIPDEVEISRLDDGLPTQIRQMAAKLSDEALETLDNWVKTSTDFRYDNGSQVCPNGLGDLEALIPASLDRVFLMTQRAAEKDGVSVDTEVVDGEIVVDDEALCPDCGGTREVVDDEGEIWDCETCR